MIASQGVYKREPLHISIIKILSCTCDKNCKDNKNNLSSGSTKIRMKFFLEEPKQILTGLGGGEQFNNMTTCHEKYYAPFGAIYAIIKHMVQWRTL